MLGLTVGLTVGAPVESASDGEIEGLFVGASVGLIVGVAVGVALGEELGDAEGEEEGVAIGDALGEELGDAEGEEEGVAVGDALGEELGDAEGEEEGAAVGDALGEELGDAEGEEEGEEDGDALGELLGENVVVGETLGEALGEAVGGSVFKIQRLDRYSESSSRFKACSGRTPKYFAGLLSIIQSAEPQATLESAPTPIAIRSTLSSLKALISESYWVTASAFIHSLGPRTQSWYSDVAEQEGSLPRQNSCLSPGSKPKSEHWRTVPSPSQKVVVSEQYPSLSPSPRTFGSPSERNTRRFLRLAVAVLVK